MPWINIKPANTGGGRLSGVPTAKLYESGQLTLSHATCALLGEPDKVLVSVEPELQRIRLEPTTPQQSGGILAVRWRQFPPPPRPEGGRQ